MCWSCRKKGEEQIGTQAKKATTRRIEMEKKRQEGEKGKTEG
jgi:hypothetical protein